MGTFETIEAGGLTPRAYAAGEAGSGTPGVVLLHAWWGLNDDVVAYVDRLAAAGFAVVAPDLFGGQVTSTMKRGPSGWPAGRTRRRSTPSPWPRSITWADPTGEPEGAPLAALGFSFGANWAMWCPAERTETVSSRRSLYYGSTGGVRSLTRSSSPRPGAFRRDGGVRTRPTRGSPSSRQRSERPAATVVIHRYPGTGRWFAEPSRDAYRAAAADLAFERTVAFLGRHLGRPTG